MSLDLFFLALQSICTSYLKYSKNHILLQKELYDKIALIKSVL